MLFGCHTSNAKFSQALVYLHAISNYFLCMFRFVISSFSRNAEFFCVFGMKENVF